MAKKEYRCADILKHCKRVLNGKKWSGPKLPKEVSGHTPQLEHTFSEEGLAANAEQGRDLLDMVLLTAFQFGYANGIRKAEAGHETMKRCIAILIKKR